jgi:hypothetical protein
MRYEWLRREGARGHGAHRAALFAILRRAVAAEGISVHTGRTVAGRVEGRLSFADGELAPRHVRPYQALSALFTPAYQSESRTLPWVRDRIVPPFGRLWPATRIQAEMVAGTFGSPLERLGL